MTIAKIVAGYVKVENRRALSDLLAHRRKVLAELQGDIGHQSGKRGQGRSGRTAEIEADQDQLNPPAGSLPENEWS